MQKKNFTQITLRDHLASCQSKGFLDFPGGIVRFVDEASLLSCFYVITISN